jgi:hypothetical protein
MEGNSHFLEKMRQICHEKEYFINVRKTIYYLFDFSCYQNWCKDKSDIFYVRNVDKKLVVSKITKGGREKHVGKFDYCEFFKWWARFWSIFSLRILMLASSAMFVSWSFVFAIVYYVVYWVIKLACKIESDIPYEHGAAEQASAFAPTKNENELEMKQQASPFNV